MHNVARSVLDIERREHAVAIASPESVRSGSQVMASEPYDYSTRTGIYPISWEEMHGICKALAVAASRFQPEVILAVGRGGFYPGTLIAHMLRVEVYPVRLSRRVNDVVVHDQPRWLVEPTLLVADRRVLIIDEICSTGETLTLVKQKAEALGAQECRSAVLYAHSWGTSIPDLIGLITDALILNPWDREVVEDGRFVFHPEYVAALAHQGIPPDPSLLIQASAVRLAKG
jgi:hypoxanthine phosphoribosyltransferase